MVKAVVVKKNFFCYNHDTNLKSGKQNLINEKYANKKIGFFTVFL
jgi:hypothetical protein